MRKLSTILRKGQKALQDLELLKILQSEISHELSSNPFQTKEMNLILSLSRGLDSFPTKLGGATPYQG
ncbi:hypothetical protein L484_000214 [Morus notabilis]|uniref:Uncharacterized protein n=1 Tax=Morus notabilis TaxID=981085 RepID=W9SLR3_9ROSA|nr:hypothetical protein L484_000214 [Morus notabilis]